MWTHDVVIGDEQSEQNHRSVELFEPRSLSNVLLKRSIETFDHLLVEAIFRGLLVQVFQSDDLFMLELEVSRIKFLQQTFGRVELL